MNPRKQTTILWLIVLAVFGAFNAAYWPARAYRIAQDPAHFETRARQMAKRGNLDGAIAELQRGITAFRPTSSEPYALYISLLERAGRQDEQKYVEPIRLFYGVQSLSEVRERDAALRTAADLYLAEHAQADWPAPTAQALLRLAIDLTSVYGAGRPVLEMTPAQHLALLQLAGGDIRTDGLIGETGVHSPVDLLVQSGGGQGMQRAVHLYVGARDLARRQRGWHVAFVDPQNGNILQWSVFDLYDDASAAKRMEEFLGQSPAGCIGVFAVFDDGAVNMTPELEEALLSFGLQQEASINWKASLVGMRYGFAAIGVKGAAAGTALQAWCPESFQGNTGHPVACGVLREGMSP